LFICFKSCSPLLLIPFNLPLLYNATIITIPTITKASTLCFDPSVAAALCVLIVEVAPATSAAIRVPVANDVTVRVEITPLSSSVVVKVTVAVVKPVWPLLAVTVYQPFVPTPPHPLSPHPLPPHPLPPQGPKPVVQAALLVAQPEYAEHKDDCKLEMVAYEALGHAEETQLAMEAVLVQCPEKALHVE
jgi:hypothetical protein